MRLLICAGGTGGGVYPALSVWQALGEQVDDVLWVGGEGGMEADLVRREGIPFTSIPASAVHGVGLRTLVGLARAARGYFAARKIIRQFRPDALFFTGGYVAIPVALAGWKKVPIVLYVPDIEPGWALKTLARFAGHIALIAKDSLVYFPNAGTALLEGRPRLTVTGHPTRRGLADWEKGQALEVLRLSPDLPILFVFGGSKGARSINRAVIPLLPGLLAEMQVLHLTGKLDWDEVQAVRSALPAGLAGRYRAFPYLYEEMGAAYAVADLVLSRAGASSVGEFPLFGVPAILVPYPWAWRYQTVNAEFLVRHGAAIIVENDALPEKLSAAVRGLMGDPARRDRMRAAMSALARPNAAGAIADCLLDTVKQFQKNNGSNVRNA
ncbi:MAG: glycosyltransferase [Anaerolineales bacterium]